ncbi:hypothetical protein V8E53_003176 [Lactarius tabidus]
MSARRELQNWDQPNELDSNLNEIFWTDLCNTFDPHKEAMPLSNNFLGNESLQVFHSETYPNADNSDHQELSAAANGQNFIPTPMESQLLGETSREGGAANWRWGSAEDASEVGLPMRVHEMQVEGPTPSTSTGAGPGEEKNLKRKREEGGECRPCKKTFTRISDAKRHRKTVHKKGKEVQAHVCKVCGTWKTNTTCNSTWRINNTTTTLGSATTVMPEVMAQIVTWNKLEWSWDVIYVLNVDHSDNLERKSKTYSYNVWLAYYGYKGPL